MDTDCPGCSSTNIVRWLNTTNTDLYCQCFDCTYAWVDRPVGAVRTIGEVLGRS